ncbi:serine/threonine protein kinase [Haliangium sp.]|uniref:serine/threonine protein kinase n=1 Tax=Haliangium sp. TaxID=2663208 RepID=UPI003D0962DB
MNDRMIGKYRITGQIGQGGMGVVFKGEHEKLGGQAAIKVLHAEWTKDETVVKRFFNEARAASRIRHGGIVEIYDFGHEDDGSAYIIMEYMEGEDLFRRMRKQGRIPIYQAIAYAQQMCNILHAAHAHNIIHRDLKPGNVFLVPDPQVLGGERVKLLDFGIAKVQLDGDANAAKTRADTLMGTPTYMAPEQCTGATNVDQRSDLYSVGCILFEMLCGRPPFVGEPTDVMVAKMRDDPPPPSQFQPEIWPELEQVVLRSLARMGADRYQSASQFEAALAQLNPMTQVGLGTSPQGTLSQAAAAAATGAAQAGPRSRWLVPALAFVLTVAAGGTGVMFWSQYGRGAEPPEVLPAITPDAAPRPEPTIKVLALDQVGEVPIDKALWTLDSKPPGAELIRVRYGPGDGAARVIEETPLGTLPLAILVDRDPMHVERFIVRLDQDSYADETIDLQAARDRELTVTLRPFLDVDIKSIPPGAGLYSASGDFLGDTPLSLRMPMSAAAESYVLRRDGYLDEPIEVSFERPGERSFRLRRAVSVFIQSDPSGAEVWLGEELLGVTPYRGQLAEQRQAREFVVRLDTCEDARVRLNGHKDDSKPVTLRCE